MTAAAFPPPCIKQQYSGRRSLSSWADCTKKATPLIEYSPAQKRDIGWNGAPYYRAAHFSSARCFPDGARG